MSCGSDSGELSSGNKDGHCTFKDSNEIVNHLHPKLGTECRVPVVKGELCDKVSVLCSVL